MKHFLFFVTLWCLFTQCQPRQSKKTEDVISMDTPVRQTPIAPVLVETNSCVSVGHYGDTTIAYSIDGLSAEGSEVQARYRDGRLKSAIWTIFGETGKVLIRYEFRLDNRIRTVEERYSYTNSFAEVTSDSDVKLISALRYEMDTSGTILTKIKREDFVNLFDDFKSAVPIYLKH